jgi:glycosyltransferase involved in cell wall biosynthesis
MKKAHKIIAISQHTKNDLVNYLRLKPDMINVCLLGIAGDGGQCIQKTPHLKQYSPTNWGYIRKNVSLEKEKFLLFIGGVDPRRKLVDLVSAFNNLRARGYNIKLVFAGDTMKGAFSVPSVELQNYLKNSSYLDDVYFLGFVNDNQREWLYNHAFVFVYPSVYEGFGLAILEAMQCGTPVITYKNSSILEIASDAVLYASDFQSIIRVVKELIDDDVLRKKYIRLGVSHSAKFRWSDTAKNILNIIES